MQPLDAHTWNDFARLVEKHDGIWSGCWTSPFTKKVPDRRRKTDLSKSISFVRKGLTLPCLQRLDRIRWCQFGSADVLPFIKLKRNDVELAIIRRE